MENRYWVYIVTNKPYGTLYIGVTSDLSRRVYEHREGIYHGFTKEHQLKMLVWYEEYSDVDAAIAREKKLKKWKRDWKINLIKGFNFAWRDLYDDLNK